MNYKSGMNAPAFQSFLTERSVNVMTEPEESPTRYMLPDQGEGKGVVDYSLNDHLPATYPIATTKTKKEKNRSEGYVDYSLNDLSPARYPTFNKKRKKSNKKKKNKKAKKEPGNSVHFHPTVTLKTIYTTLKNQTEEVNLTHEEYPLRVTAFALKRKGQKELLKYQHQYRPLTSRRLFMQKHIRDTLQRENGNQSSSSSPPQTPPTNSIPMNS